ncbi:MAG: hypothetical protein HYW01_00915 [Deltaproteobacteria bacterium]|nr:hypothetical protein [Deltaproteobacteria bacterium]
MDERVREEILSKRPELPKLLLLVLLLLVGIGILTFVSRVMGPNAKEAWQIYLVNFIFWTGVAQAGVIFSCALRLTSGRWGRPLLRISEGLGSFVPVSFILLMILLFVGKDYVLPYATEHYHHPKDVWLNMSFVAGRNIIGFLLLFTLSFIYLYYSLRQDLGGIGNKVSGICGWIASGWKGEEERKECWNKLIKLAPAVAIIYAVVLSVIAWDFMMSLDHNWFSTLFGPYYFIASLLAAMGATIILSTFVRKHLHLQDYITQFQYYDIGKLFLAFSMFWVYLMFSQFLAIWYANMPEETGFVIARVRVEPFKTLSWVVLSCCFFFPFISLIPRTNKVVAPILVSIASVSFIGLWLEKFVLVMPSFSPEISFGLTQILITLGFVAAFILTFLLFIRTFPIIPVGDPLFSGKADSHHSGGH